MRPSPIERARRIQEVRDLLAQGLPQIHIAAKVGMTPSNLCSYIQRNKLRTWVARCKGRHDSGWGRERIDPSHLTAEHLYQARRLDVEPGRYAWLLTCPRGGNAGGSKVDRSLR